MAQIPQGYTYQDIDDAALAIEMFGDDELERYAAEYEAAQNWCADNNDRLTDRQVSSATPPEVVANASQTNRS